MKLVKAEDRAFSAAKARLWDSLVEKVRMTTHIAAFSVKSKINFFKAAFSQSE